MLELTRQQMALLERLEAHGFQFVAFPLYSSYVGVKRGNCAALLAPVEGGGMKIIGAPHYLVEGNLGVRVIRGGREWFIWKKNQLEVTPERQAELERFAADLSTLLMARE